MRTHLRAFESVMHPTHTARVFRPALALAALLLLLVLGLQSGCGARQSADARLAPVSNAMVLPASPDALRDFASTAPERDDQAYLLAFTRLLFADFDGAVRALIDETPTWESDALRVGRLAFLIWNYQNIIDLEPLRQWANAQDRASMVPVEAVLHQELSSYLSVDLLIEEDADTLPLALDFGGAASWNVYGPVSSHLSQSVRSMGVAANVKSIQDLPHRSTQVNRRQETRLGSIGDNPSRGSVMLYETFLQVDAPTTLVFASFGGADYLSLWVGDTLTLQRYAEDGNEPAYLTRTVRLDAGVHRVLMKHGGRESSVRTIRAVAIDGELKNFAADIGPATQTKATIVPAQPKNVSAWLSPQTDEGLTPWLVAVSVAMLGDDGLLWTLSDAEFETEHPLVSFIRANILENLGNYGLGKARALQELRSIDERWLPLEGVEMMAAQLAFTASDDDTAPQALAPAAMDPAASPHVRRAYASMVGQLGYDALAWRTLAQLSKEYPTWCAVWREYLQRSVGYRGLLTEADFEGAPRSCHDVRQLEVLATKVWRGESADYNASLLRDLARRPGSQAFAVSAFWQFLQSEGADAAERYLQTLDLRGLRAEELVPLRAALAFVRSGQAETVAAIDQGLAQRPENAVLQRQAWSLDARSAFEALRVDGLEALKEYRANQRDASAVADIVYVLDYGAWRYFEEGGAVKIVHQLFELNSREAISSMGEIGVPHNAITLEMRVIKPDGSLRTPVQIDEKQSLSLPDLEIGDVLEIESVEFIPPNMEEVLGYQSGGFFFQATSAPMHLSQMVVEYPARWGDEALLEVHHFDGERTRTTQGNYVRETLTVHKSPTMVSERWTPDPQEYFPWASFHAFRSKDVEVEGYADYVGTRVAPSAEIDAMRRTVLAGVRGEAAQVEALFRFVADEVVMSSGFFGVSALETARMMRGDRMSLLFALLQSAGFDPQVTLVESFDGPRYASEVFRVDRFDSVLLHVRVGTKDYWLDPNREFAPFNVLQSYMQGGEALVILGSRLGEELTVPTSPDLDARNRSVVELWLDEEGNARLSYVYHYSPDYAAGMRDSLRQVPSERDRVRYMEQFLSANYGPSTIEKLIIEGAEEPSTPLVFRMEARIDGLATKRGDELYIDRAFEPPAQFLGYTAASNRQLPLLIDSPTFTDIEVTIHPPAGYRRSRRLESLELSHGDYHYARSVKDAAGEAVRWVRRVTVPRGRVQPEAYGALAQFAQGVRDAERVRLQWMRDGSGD